MVKLTITKEVMRKWQSIVDMMAKTFAVPAGFIVRHTEEGYEVLVASNNKENPYKAGTLISNDINIFCRKVVSENQMFAIYNAGTRKEWFNNPEVAEDGFNTYVGFPIKNPDGSVFGTICVMDYKTKPFGRNYIELLKQFCSVAELDLVTLKQLQDVTDLSLKDDLTGLYNRRGFNILSQSQLNPSNAASDKIALVIVDINLLKHINDQHGHPAGDKAIVLTSEALTNACRSSDIVARVGGDEFFVGLYVNNEDEIDTILNRARSYLEQHAPDFLPITFCSGYSIKNCKDLKNLNLVELIDEADKSLYEQKFERSSHKLEHL